MLIYPSGAITLTQMECTVCTPRYLIYLLTHGQVVEYGFLSVKV